MYTSHLRKSRWAHVNVKLHFYITVVLGLRSKILNQNKVDERFGNPPNFAAVSECTLQHSMFYSWYERLDHKAQSSEVPTLVSIQNAFWWFAPQRIWGWQDILNFSWCFENQDSPFTLSLAVTRSGPIFPLKSSPPPPPSLFPSPSTILVTVGSAFLIGCSLRVQRLTENVEFFMLFEEWEIRIGMSMIGCYNGSPSQWINFQCFMEIEWYKEDETRRYHTSTLNCDGGRVNGLWALSHEVFPWTKHFFFSVLGRLKFLLGLPSTCNRVR